MKTTVSSIATQLKKGQRLVDDSLCLAPGGCTIRLRSNSALLLKTLKAYFSHVVIDPVEAEIDLVAIDSEPLDLGVTLTDWPREPGKQGRKDAVLELSGGRLILKVRTGMLFLQSESERIAAGPCLQYDNQLINFINAQYMNWLQHRQWLICHAAGLVYRGHALAFAGFSGGGKSTLMLHLLGCDGFSYLTNDRLFIRSSGQTVEAAGIPKLPRINPGTIVHNSRLHSLLSEQQRERLLKLPDDELWELEEKYDVLVESLYGVDRIVQQAPLKVLFILNWQRESRQPVDIHRVELNGRRELLGAIMKSPGPFYQYADGHFHQSNTPFNEAAYLALLDRVTVYEVTGGVDFAALSQRVVEL